MKLKNCSFTFYILAILCQTSFAQDTLKHCGTDEFMHSVFQDNPNAVLNQQLLEQFTVQYQQNSNTRQQYIIPVVFHIIHNYGIENISDAQVIDAVKILNQDFNKLNGDTSAIINQYKPIAANCGFEFRLASIDPNGNCTNGIEHILSGSTYSGGEDSKLNPWPSDKYLNIWVVKEIASGAAGYTYYPGSADFDKDGILILSSYVGSIGTGHYETARALTHEVGHWINLKHTWGDSNSPGVACGDDNVFDTPQTKGWTSCNLTGAVCSSTIENVQNFMEYAYCSCMFSTGQKARMISALNSSISGRNNLWSSSNLVATGTSNSSSPNACIPVADFFSTYKFACTGDPIELVDKSWNAKVLYRFWNISGASAASSLSDSVISVTYNTPGIYSISLLAGNNVGSDLKERTNLIQVLSDTALFANGYSESFESGNFPFNNFIPDYTGDIDWFIKSTVGYAGNHCLALNNYIANSGISYGVLGPTFNISTIPNLLLTFHVSYTQRSANNNDRLRVMVSENCGKTWVPRYAKSGNQLATSSIHPFNFTPTPSEWRMETVNISPNSNSTNLRIKFDFLSDGGNNIFIDDINLGGYSLTENVFDEHSVYLFPNPVTDRFGLQLNLKTDIEGSIKLYDVTGRLMEEIYSGKIKKDASISVDVSKYPAQFFIIELNGSNGTRQVYRFVKI